MNVTDETTIVDHIYHKKNDNRKSELRATNFSNNTANSGLMSNNTSGHTGVSFRETSQTWRARIWKNKKTYCLGDFKTKEEAIQARINAEKELFGDFVYKIKKGD